MTLRTLFDQYAVISDKSGRQSFVFANPALMAGRNLMALQQEIERESWLARRRGHKLVVELDALRRFVMEDAGRYEIGRGPVESCARRVMQGEWSFDTALRRLVEPESALNLTALYAHIIVVDAQTRVRTEPGAAVLHCRLLAAACMELDGAGAVSEAAEIAAVGAIQITGVALVAVPDGQWLEAARELGDWLEKRLQAPADLERRAAVLHALGVLYSSLPSMSNPHEVESAGRGRSRQRALEALRGRIPADVHMQAHPLPGDQEMLERSLTLFEAALPNRSGRSRGVTLKAIAQTRLLLRQNFGIAQDDAALRALCHEALQLSPTDSENHRNVQYLLMNLGENLQPADVSPQGIDPARDALQRAALFKRSDPAKALGILRDAAPLFDASRGESIRRERLDMILRLVGPASGALDVTLYPRGLAQAISAMEADPDFGQLGPDALAATLFQLAWRTTMDDEEHLGLSLLQSAVEASERFAWQQEHVMYLFSILSTNAGVNAFDGKEFGEAAKAYGLALAPLLRLGLSERVLEVLARLANIAGLLPDDARSSMLIDLAAHAFSVAEQLGDAGIQSLDQVYVAVAGSPSGAGGGVSQKSWGLLLQLAKGMLFDAAMRREGDFDWRHDPELVALDRRITGLTRQVCAIQVPAPISDVLLLCAVSATSALDADTPQHELRNLRQMFDARAQRRYARSIVRPSIFNPSAIGELLGERSVLLDYFFGAYQNGQSAMYVSICTRDETTVVANVLTDAKQLIVDAQTTQAVIDPIGRRALRLREALRVDSGDQALTADARTALDDDFELMLGTPVWNKLRELRRSGKDHLCVRPHHAMRYYPVALLGRDGLALASQWIVTVLPSAECLVRSSTPPRKTTGTALGLSYSNQSRDDVPALPNARGEVKRVARAMGTDPVLDEEVTAEAVLTACGRSRWVHLCAHGAQDSGAPLFHSVLVTPSAAFGDRLCAKDIIGQDLRGLELLTLGSCESALGRFDAGDNLSGLPAAFLAAGVQAMIAALWPLEDEVAPIFFEALYRQLERKTPRLDAFAKAQAAVRAARPQARHWAGFCYLGGWDVVGATAVPEEDLHFQLKRREN